MSWGRSIAICETETPRGRRYYADGKRISRALLVAIKSESRLDSFRTVIHGNVTRQYCCATRESQS